MTDPRAETTLLEEAAAELRKARDANEKRRELAAEMAGAKLRVEDIRREVADRSMELAAAFTRLAAIERDAKPAAEAPVLPHELELRIADALSMAVRYPATDGEHHKAWIVDQVVRRLTGCLDDGEVTAEYLRFREEEDDWDWDEGIAP